VARQRFVPLVDLSRDDRAARTLVDVTGLRDTIRERPGRRLTDRRGRATGTRVRDLPITLDKLLLAE
jgi:hypothetical protein